MPCSTSKVPTVSAGLPVLRSSSSFLSNIDQLSRRISTLRATQKQRDAIQPPANVIVDMPQSPRLWMSDLTSRSPGCQRPPFSSDHQSVAHTLSTLYKPLQWEPNSLVGMPNHQRVTVGASFIDSTLPDTPGETLDSSYLGKLLLTKRCSGTMLTGLGDRQGPGNFILELCNDHSRTSPHDLISQAAPHSRSQENLTNSPIDAMCGFPSLDVCQALVRCYFFHVHFFMPILDAKHFLTEFNERGCEMSSPLLLWAIFLAAANVRETSCSKQKTDISQFIEAEVLEMAHFATKAAMKRRMYQCAKVSTVLPRQPSALRC